MKSLILLFSIFFLSSAHGARIIGNGADAMVCEQPPPEFPHHFPMLFDFWEAIDMSRLKLWAPEGKTYQEKMFSFTKRLANRFPVMAKMFESDFALFQEKSDPKYGREWDDVKDDFPRERYSSQKPEEAYHGNLPKGCSLKQVANQRPPVFPLHPWFLLNGELWEPKHESERAQALDEDSKCGAAVHEITYRWGLGFGLTDSIGVRYLVGLFFSTDLEKHSDAVWIAGFLQSYLKYYEIGGLRFPLFSGNPDNCEFAKSAGFVRAVGPECNGSPIRWARSIKFDGGSLRAIDYNQTEEVEYSSDRVLASIQTRSMTFEKEGSSVHVQLNGILLVTPTNRSGRSAKFEIDGKIDVNSGRFCGRALSLDSSESGQPRIYQDVCGSFESLLNPKSAVSQP